MPIIAALVADSVVVEHRVVVLPVSISIQTLIIAGSAGGHAQQAHRVVQVGVSTHRPPLQIAVPVERLVLPGNRAVGEHVWTSKVTTITVVRVGIRVPLARPVVVEHVSIQPQTLTTVVDVAGDVRQVLRVVRVCARLSRRTQITAALVGRSVLQVNLVVVGVVAI